MKIKILELTRQHMKCIIQDVTPSFINSLRRILLSEIPKMAIHEVEFHLGPIRDRETGEMFESMAPLFDEIIAHRLSMLPVPTDTRLFNFRDECVCSGEGCPNCRIMYVLNKHGPSTVFSGDLEPISGDSSGEVKAYDIIEDLIPIVKLNDHEALLIYATAILGRAKDHAKWQVCDSVGYKYFPNITIDDALCDNGGGCIDICPKDVLGFNTKGNLSVKNLLNCDQCFACVNICEPQKERGKRSGTMRKAIHVEGKPDMFVFTMDTDGSYTAKDAFETALNILEKKYREFRESISSMK